MTCGFIFQIKTGGGVLSSPLKCVGHTLMEMKRTPPVLIWKIKPQVVFYRPECKY